MENQNANSNVITPSEFEVVNELNELCNSNSFWMFMAMQSIIFQSENKAQVQSQIDKFPEQWQNILRRYYDENVTNTFKSNIRNFFDIYIAYLNNIVIGRYEICSELIDQWKYTGSIIAKNFAEINPYWGQNEWYAIIDNQINILDREIRSNVIGDYSTLPLSYDVYNRVTSDIANYIAQGLIKQFSL